MFSNDQMHSLFTILLNSLDEIENSKSGQKVVRNHSVLHDNHFS